MIKTLFSDAVNIASPYQFSQFLSSSIHLKNSCFIFTLSNCPYPASTGCKISVALAKPYFFVPLGYHKKEQRGCFPWTAGLRVLLAHSLQKSRQPKHLVEINIYNRVPCFFFRRFWYSLSFSSENNGNPFTNPYQQYDQNRSPASDVCWFTIHSHPFLECRTSFYTLLRMARGTGQRLIADDINNNLISPCSKFLCPSAH